MISRDAQEVIVGVGEFVMIFIAGFVGSRKSGTYLLLLSILMGIPLGVWLDSVASDGAPCSFIGLPMELWFVGFTGRLLGKKIRRRPHENGPRSCEICHYNLTGNVSGVCPECGTKIAEAK